MDERLKRLIQRREAAGTERETLLDKRKAIVDLAEEEAREELSTEEDTEYRDLTGKVKVLDETLRSYDERIQELADEAERSQKVSDGALALQRAQARVQVVSEARTYEQGNGKSYLQDLMRVQMRMDDGASAARLQRHATEVATDKEFRDLNRTDGNGGQFVPPLWLMSQYIELARAGRAYANLCPSQGLPPGTDSISIPKILTGTAAAIQTADNGAVVETDLTDGAVTAPVRTVAGQQDVAIQLLDQSPVSFDQVIFRDLVADYASKVDLQVINGTGASGQVTGVRSTSGIQTIALTGLTVADVYPKLADAIQRVQTSRFMPPTHIVMHPRRWAAFLAAVDTQKRPLVVPGAGNPVNAMGTTDGVLSEQVVGHMLGLPVVTDPNLPTTLGTTPDNTQDVIHVVRASDLLLFESGIRTRVLPEVGSGTLTVRLQVYGYLAFTAARYPQSVVEIGGVGLVAPTF